MKKLFFIIPVLIAVSFTISAFCEELRVMNAEASTIENDNPEVGPGKAIDGDLKTRWASQWADNQWIVLDFGTKKRLNFVTIDWEPAYSSSYEIQISDDNRGWKPVFRNNECFGNREEIYVGDSRARYLKLVCLTRATKWGHSIYEIKAENRSGPIFPSAPEDLKAIPKRNAIVLTWKTSSTDISGFNVYRSLLQDEIPEKINRKPVKTTQYADIDVENGKSYSYLVKAFKYQGAESGASENIRGSVPDISVPVNLTSGGFPVYEGASRDNSGRFGLLTYPWIETPYPLASWEAPWVTDGTLNFFLKKDLCISAPPNDIFLVRRGIPGKKEVIDCNWVSKTVRLDYGSFSYALTYGLCTPGLMMQSEDHTLSLSSTGLSDCAFFTVSGVQIKSGAKSYDRQRDGKMAENWILLMRDNGESPVLLVLKRCPEKISLKNGELDVDFSGPFGQAVLSVPFGIDNTPKKLITAKGLEAGILEKCRFWSKALLAYPVNCREYFWVEKENGRVGVRDRYDYLMIEDEWGTVPMQTAPLPPLVSFARDAAYPVKVISKNIVDYDFPTWYGPFKGALGTNIAEYYLPIPPLQHKSDVCPIDSNENAKKMNAMVRNGFQFWSGGPNGMWNTVPEPIWEHSPMDGGNLDPYTWMGVFSSPLTSLSILDDQTKMELNDILDKRLCIPFIRYSRLMPIETRIEPYTKSVFNVYWLNRSVTPEGRYFDGDEEAGCVLSSLYYYALYMGDWDTIRKSWNAIKNMASWWESINDWAYLSSGCCEDGRKSSLDMLNATYPGMLAYSKMSYMIGDKVTGDKALYMAVRAAVPTVMRLKFDRYAKKYYPFIDENSVIAGFNETGPDFSGFPKSLGEGLSIQLLDSARSGVYPELMNLYATYAKEEITGYLNKVKNRYPEFYNDAYGIHFIYALAFLGMDKDRLPDYLSHNLDASATACAWDWRGIYYAHGTASVLAEGSPLWLSDSWAPAKYINASYDREKKESVLTFDASHQKNLYIEAHCDRCPSRVIFGDGKSLSRVYLETVTRVRTNTWYYDEKSHFLHANLDGGKIVALKIRE